MRRQMESQLPPTAGPSASGGGKGPAANLAARRAAGEVHADPVQEKVVQRLQAVYDQLVAMADHPAPRPSLLARLGLGPADCIAVEDSGNGLAAAAGAGIPVVITRSTYFSDDDFAEALLVVDDLSDINA